MDDDNKKYVTSQKEVLNILQCEQRRYLELLKHGLLKKSNNPDLPLYQFLKKDLEFFKNLVCLSRLQLLRLFVKNLSEEKINEILAQEG